MTLLAIPAPLLRKNQVYGHVLKFIIYSLTRYRQKKVQTLTMLFEIPFSFLEERTLAVSRTKKAGCVLLAGIGNHVPTRVRTRFGGNQIPRKGSGFGIR